VKTQWGMMAVTLLLSGTVNAKIVDTDPIYKQIETSNDSSERSNFILSAGYTSGGEDLAGFEFNDGSIEMVESGSGLYLGAGGSYRFENSPFSFKGLMAYHFDSVTADVYGGGEEDVNFSRVELDLLAQYHITEQLFLGAGLTRHFGVELDSSWGDSIEFDAALGYVVEFGYRFKTIALSARYTDISYENEFLSPIDSSNVGIFIDFYI